MFGWTKDSSVVRYHNADGSVAESDLAALDIFYSRHHPNKISADDLGPTKTIEPTPAEGPTPVNPVVASPQTAAGSTVTV